MWLAAINSTRTIRVMNHVWRAINTVTELIFTTDTMDDLHELSSVAFDEDKMLPTLDGTYSCSLLVCRLWSWLVGCWCTRENSHWNCMLSPRPKVGRGFPETPRPTVATGTTFQRWDTAPCSVSMSESRRLRCANMIGLWPIIFASYECVLSY